MAMLFLALGTLQTVILGREQLMFSDWCSCDSVAQKATLFTLARGWHDLVCQENATVGCGCSRLGDKGNTRSA